MFKDYGGSGTFRIRDSLTQLYPEPPNPTLPEVMYMFRPHMFMGTGPPSWTGLKLQRSPRGQQENNHLSLRA